MVYSGAWGKLIREKNQKSKISWHCPFKRKILNLYSVRGAGGSAGVRIRIILIQIRIVAFLFNTDLDQAPH